VLASEIKLRAGPGASYVIVASAKQGETFELIGKDAEPPAWWQMRRPANGTAWISESPDLVKTTGPVDSLPVVPACAIPVPCPGCVTCHLVRQGRCSVVPVGPQDKECIDTFVPSDFGLQQAIPVSGIRIDMVNRAEPNYTWGYSIWEIEAYGRDAPDENLLLNGGATANALTSLGTSSPALAIDGEMPYLPRDQGGGASRWESVHQQDPQWFEVTLSGTARTTPIERLVLRWQEAYASDYCVTLMPTP
jgi:hypothetical protein